MAQKKYRIFTNLTSRVAPTICKAHQIVDEFKADPKTTIIEVWQIISRLQKTNGFRKSPSPIKCIPSKIGKEKLIGKK